MFAPAIPDDAARLAALGRLDVLDTPPEPAFDDLTRLAAAVCGTPIALVSLVDSCRQWFKSRHGLDATETPRDVAFCAHAIAHPDLFVVPDAAADPRFRDNPLVTGAPHVRFYAGAPLTTADGHAVGTLCVIDTVPRTLTAVQAEALRVLGRQVVAQLAVRQQLQSSQVKLKQHETFRVLFEASSDAHLLFDEADGIIDCNAAAVAMLRYTHKSQVLALHPAALSPEFQPDGRRSMEKCVEMDATARANGHHRFDWTHRRADGEDFPCEVTLTPTALHGRSVLLVVWHDLTERKKVEDALRESEQRFRSAFEDAAIGMALVAPNGRWLRVNRSLCGMLGYTDAELIATDFQTITHPDDLHADLGLVRRVLSGELATYQMEKRYFHKSGRVVHALLAVSLVRGPTGEPLYFVSQVKNITARKTAEAALRASEAKFRRTVDRLAEGVFVVDPTTRRIVEANAALQTMLGYTPAEFLTLGIGDLVADEPPDAIARGVRHVEDKLAADGRCDLGRRTFRRKDGRPVPVDVRVTLVPDGGAGLHAVVVKDISEQVEYENRLVRSQAELEEVNARLRTLVDTDGLTGVKNRGAFNRRVGEEFVRAARYGHPLSLVLLDVDHFKPFNDAFGHPAGDEALRAVARTLRESARSSDVVARYGGEEFVVILPDTDSAGAMVVAERFRRAVADQRWDQRPVTVSVGVATLTATTASVAELVQEADEALYRSKMTGRNRVTHCSGPIAMDLTRRGELVAGG